MKFPEILPVLNTLNISHNYLKTADSLDQLRDCHFVSVLDISHNRIEDIAIVKVRFLIYVLEIVFIYLPSIFVLDFERHEITPRTYPNRKSGGQ